MSTAALTGAPARWIFPVAPAEAVEALARRLGLRLPAARILWSRDIRDPEAASRFLHPRLEDLHDPFALADMDVAARRLAAAVAAGERILLYGDYDVDGTSSIVILHTALRLAGAFALFHVPHRILEGYGMRTEIIEEAAADGVRLIVSVDTGIRAGDVTARARELGVDVIVTDHHLPEGELPPALAVLNPNRPDCPYPAKNLCGAAVAMKLAQGLFHALGWDPARQRKVSDSLLKLAAIATVADVVPLTGENRIIVRHGLEGLRDPRNPGLKALFAIAKIEEGEAPSARQIAFQIGPRLNAAGRMDDARNVIELFLTPDAARAAEIAGLLDTLNRERQQTEEEIRDQILAACLASPVTPAQAGLVFSAPGWHPGVIGIVAGRLAERYCRPVFVLAEDPETGEAKGSGRAGGPFHLLEALEAMPDLFLRFGGHKQAAGLTMRADRVAEFRERFAAFAATRLSPEDLCPVHEFDAAISLAELDDEAAAEVLSLAPFGAGNPPPLLAIEAAELAAPPDVKNGKHLFLKLRQGGVTRQVKGWNLAPLAAGLRAGDVIDAAVLLEEDAWSRARGGSFWTLILKDLRIR